MAKTEKELNELKEEYNKLTSKLKELTTDELKMVTGGSMFDIPENNHQYAPNFYDGEVDKDKFNK